MSKLVADPAWRVEANEQGLVLTAGADQSYLVPGLSGAHVVLLGRLFDQHGAFEPKGLPHEVRMVLPQLRSLGALRPESLPVPARPQRLRVGVRVLGEATGALLAALEEQFGEAHDAELHLVVRTTATLREMMTEAEVLAPLGAHLLLDLGYHHTVSLGPLVVPGQSACLACMAVRLGRRWGDPPPPTRPKSLERPELAIALAVHAINGIGAGSLALLDRIVSYHLDELTGTAEHVLPAAGCPVCPGLPVGRTTLPWEAET